MTETDNIVAVTFTDNSAAYEGLSVLRQCAADGRIELDAAAVVTRGKDGRLSVPEGDETWVGTGTLGGSLVGILVGVLGGPIGMLIGWGTGALIGGVLDVDQSERGDELIAEFGRMVSPGSTALVAEVVEPAVEVVDGEMASLGGTVHRRPAADVLAELEAAEEAAEEAEATARRVVREQKKKDRKEKVEDRKAALKAKLGRKS